VHPRPYLCSLYFPRDEPPFLARFPVFFEASASLSRDDVLRFGAVSRATACVLHVHGVYSFTDSKRTTGHEQTR
jgi:hypothetical protein